MRYCYFGPHPDERDGGQIVNFYLLKKQNELRPRDEYYGIPKVYEELNAARLPWVNYPPIVPRDRIAEFMYGLNIPLINIFHIGRMDFEPLLDPIHDVGGRIVCHQTLHWPDDDVLKSERLDEIDAIVAPTEYAKRIFQTVAKLPPDRVPVIPHGVDMTRFYRHQTPLKNQLGIKPGQAVILYSGRLSFWKGVQELIPIMRHFTQIYDCVFIIRGGAFEGVEESMKLAYIFDRMSRNNPNIIFLPEWQSPEFMEELYAFTDILIFNSAHEGFGVPLIEAQAVGAVPVVTAIANHAEIMGHSGERGILLDPKVEVGVVNDGTVLKVAASDQLAGAIGWLLDNPEEMVYMGQRGVENVKERFELTDVAIKWLQLYDSLCPPDAYSMDEEMQKRLLLGE